MRRRVAILLPLALLAAACGGGKKAAGSAGQSHTVRAVAKAFYDAGLPFTALVTGNPYVTGQQPFLPGKLNSSDLAAAGFQSRSASLVSTTSPRRRTSSHR